MSSLVLALPPAPGAPASPATPGKNHLCEERYGNIVSTVCYTTYDTEDSPYPSYGKKEILSAVGFPDLAAGYTISRYLYAVVRNAKRSVWFGYIAHSKPEQSELLGCFEIVVAFRGTQSPHERQMNKDTVLVPFKAIDPSAKALVRAGTLSIYGSANPSILPFGGRSLRDQIMDEVRELLIKNDQQQHTRIVSTGYSLGASLATLAASDLSVNVVNARVTNIKARLVAYASPRVGNLEFKTIVERQQNLEIIRYSCIGDPVPFDPDFEVIDGEFYPNPNYEEIGKTRLLDWTKSPHIKLSVIEEFLKDPFAGAITGQFHSLELYLHTAAACNSCGFRFLEQPKGIPIETILSKHKLPSHIHSALTNSKEEDREKLIAALEAYLSEVEYVKRQAQARKQEEEEQSTFRTRSKRAKITPWPRDPSLLNRSGDGKFSFLKEEYDVPPSWMTGFPNKGMAQVEDGTWLPRSKRSWDIPAEDNENFN